MAKANQKGTFTKEQERGLKILNKLGLFNNKGNTIEIHPRYWELLKKADRLSDEDKKVDEEGVEDLEEYCRRVSLQMVGSMIPWFCEKLTEKEVKENILGKLPKKDVDALYSVIYAFNYEVVKTRIETGSFPWEIIQKRNKNE
jgi:hypothetical protein